MVKQNKLTVDDEQGFIQGARTGQQRIVYEEICKKFIKDGDKILNLGSGLHFLFEKYIKTRKKVEVTAVDILKPKSSPEPVDHFINLSVEELFDLKKKFDVICFFELIEHLDKTDELIVNCRQHLKKDGLLIFTYPNLSSAACRLELLLGFQPHFLEISNINSNFGGGIFSKISNPGAVPVHHIRGFTYRAMKEFLAFHGLMITKTLSLKFKMFKYFPSLGTEVLLVCQLADKKSRTI